MCVKPMLQSFGAGLILGRRLRRPVILDIDDWERGFLFDSVYWEARHYGLGWLTRTTSPLYIRLLEGSVRRTAAVTVSNTFLQGVFGGHWIPHLRDADEFHPRPAMSMDGRKAVLFAGAPRSHKGLPTLVKAWRWLDRTDAVLRLAVPDPSSPDIAQLEPSTCRNMTVTGPHHFHEVPQLLADASIVVVPQENVPGAVGQLPAKLLEAMAAARPIVATDVCDSSRWLADGAGLTVPPGSYRDLGAAIGYLLDNPHVAEAMGLRARERLLRFGAAGTLSSRLCDVVESAIHGDQVPCQPAFTRSIETA